MEEIGLFPLGIVLLPSEHVPLHIFEPRYRELAECLDEQQEFGVIYADGDGVREVGTRARRLGRVRTGARRTGPRVVQARTLVS